MFEFLGDQDTPRTSRSNIDDADEIEEIADIRDTNENTTLDTEVTLENTAQNSVSHEKQQEPAEKQPMISRPGKKTTSQIN
ncbi:unnamed protein product [Parnassius apollo]|uniref:(apollo) hypothetical protein n=1 Tax=Parnassius apollo TaxID=110799 RepID=A0A8S3WJK4_PARAO|nr:unnamed protein product [Parnassius apollo]